MKIRFLLLISLYFFYDLSYAQIKYRKRGNESATFGKSIIQIGGGYNFIFLNPTGINYSLQKYNENNPLLQAFSKIEMLNGFSGALTFYGSKEDKKQTRYLFEIGYTGGSQKTSAKALTTNSLLIPSQTTIGLDMHNFHLRAGTFPILGMIDVGIGGGIDGGFSNLYIETQNGKENLDSPFLIGASVFLPIYINFGQNSKFSLGIRPYYQYQFTTSNASKLYNHLNLIAVAKDETKTKYALHNYGVELHLVFMLSRLNYL
jgi:hypothetical protein